MDAWLIVLIIIFSVMIVITNTYLMIIYVHPDDKGVGNALIYKIIVVLGFSLAFGLVMMIPLDISNARNNGGLDMTNFWLAMYFLVFLFVVFILPFSIVLYESDPDTKFIKRICWALIYELIIIVVWFMFIFISYAFWKTAYLPISTIAKNQSQL